ncbi:MAG: RdgB/HAM1 family non-canonical purine NTP pyrophosphatase [Eubacterium sp.]|nr:RdgB/HAM1 family non-canonical purine NTP pyrophosphatase [Eubacterium sp.]
MDFILATNNMKKLAEMQRILSPLGINVVTAKMLGKELEEVVEDGDTFEANARLKAYAACKQMNMPAIADDSGFCVDYLDGAPGIYSARFSGGHGNDEANNDLLLEKLDGVPLEQRGAEYVCAICCVFPDGREISVRGICRGFIGFERDGNEGFGYDPLFLVDGRAFGRYTAEEKDRISHRGNALRLLVNELEKIL